MQVEDIKEYSTKIKRTEEEIAKGIIGQRNVIHHILLAILADGNVSVSYTHLTLPTILLV